MADAYKKFAGDTCKTVFRLNYLIFDIISEEKKQIANIYSKALSWPVS